VGRPGLAFCLFWLVPAAPIVAAPIVAVADTAGRPRSVAVFDFEFVNTSLQPTTPAEADRLRRLGEALAGALEASGHYHVVGTEAIRAAAGAPLTPRDCNGCELAVARAAGAELAAYGWVQKVSNLILNINLVIEDATTGRHVAAGSVDIRGNTDETWAHGLRFLLREHPPPE
jgi:hypothetical protein